MEPFRIFVVDDDLVFREFLKYVLSGDTGYDIETFELGGQCLENLHKKPSLITIDNSLPDMSGQELMENIRKELPGAGIIIVSGGGDPDTVDEMLKMGAFAYIVKSKETPEHLLRAVRMFRRTLSAGPENESPQE